MFVNSLIQIHVPVSDYLSKHQSSADLSSPAAPLEKFLSWTGDNIDCSFYLLEQ